MDVGLPMIKMKLRAPAVPLITVDGIYGNQTKAAVTAVQRISGLPQTGAAGPLTWNAIVNLYNEYR